MQTFFLPAVLTAGAGVSVLIQQALNAKVGTELRPLVRLHELLSWQSFDHADEWPRDVRIRNADVGEAPCALRR